MQECEGFIKDADCTKDTPLMYGEPGYTDNMVPAKG